MEATKQQMIEAFDNKWKHVKLTDVPPHGEQLVTMCDYEHTELRADLIRLISNLMPDEQQIEDAEYAYAHREGSYLFVAGAHWLRQYLEEILKIGMDEQKTDLMVWMNEIVGRKNMSIRLISAIYTVYEKKRFLEDVPELIDRRLRNAGRKTRAEYNKLRTEYLAKKQKI